jgi:DNA modification methylase
MDVIEQHRGTNWIAYHADSVEVATRLPSCSVDFSIFSPPFSSLYVYSNSPRDLGNARTYEQFFEHYDYLAREQFRVTKAGRLLAAHCMNVPISKERDGYIGVRDFRGDLIRAYERAGFIYHSEVCIWKDPVVEMQRTKALGLLHKQVKKDAAMSRQGLAEYLIVMRKPGKNPEPVTHTDDSMPIPVWQRYASPVWMDIDPADTLQARSAREDDDERHLCCLQLEVIRRGIELWTNPGDVVWSPFMGVGSEGYIAVGGTTTKGLRLAAPRRYVGGELKDSYYGQAVRNLGAAEVPDAQIDLFGGVQTSMFTAAAG